MRRLTLWHQWQSTCTEWERSDSQKYMSEKPFEAGTRRVCSPCFGNICKRKTRTIELPISNLLRSKTGKSMQTRNWSIVVNQKRVFEVIGYLKADEVKVEELGEGRREVCGGGWEGGDEKVEEVDMKWRSGEGFSSRLYCLDSKPRKHPSPDWSTCICHKSKAMIVRFNLTLLYISIISLHFSDPWVTLGLNGVSFSFT